MQTPASGESVGSRRERRQLDRSRRSTRRQQQEQAARQRRTVILAGSIVGLVLVALVAFKIVSGGSSVPATPDSPAPDSLVAQLTSVPAATLDQVGRGTLTQLPFPVRADVQRDANGLPLISYAGAEYCPFCAGERWAMIAALGRFGSFSGLSLSHSATDDVYPNTPTFTFVGSTYTSQYVDFTPVELQSNVKVGGSYQTLQTPTPAQNTLLSTYDAAPYVSADSAGSIPFIDFAGQYVVSGASFDVGVLHNMTQSQVVAALSDPSTPQAKAILGTTNALTAALCSTTADTPASVCSDPAVQSIEAALAAQPAPTH